jgi:DNA invertase Pin-like site-specific DNA recombinase
MSTKNKNGNQLRFAALVRVSTEKQEQQGESLRTQRNSVERSVANLGGRIVEWYGGQEHATPGWEKGEVDRLLVDAQKGQFDAVIVAYADRWSRDNAKSKEGLDAFRKHRIQFFVGSMEMDLFDPQVKFILGMHAEVGEFIAGQQNKKSLESRIERARRGIPSGGRKPWGRIYDRKTEQWSIDTEKQSQLKEIAKRYLDGDTLENLAKEYGWHCGNLRETLRDRAGDTWTLRFRSKTLNIDETAVIAVHRLLDQKTIQDVRDRLVANRTHLRGRPINDYLLNGHVFCAACGFSMTAQPAKSYFYYRHSRWALDRCPLKPLPFVPAKQLEEEVVHQLFKTLGNPAAIRRSIKASVPDCDEAIKRRARVQDDLDGVVKSRERVLALVAKDVVTMEQAEAQLRGIRERETTLRKELDRLEVLLANVPTEDDLRCYVERIETSIGPQIFVIDEEGNERIGGNDVHSWVYMGRDDERKMLQAVFAGALVDGRKAGVYVYPLGKHRPHRQKKWGFTIRGRLDFECVMSHVGH